MVGNVLIVTSILYSMYLEKFVHKHGDSFGTRVIASIYFRRFSFIASNKILYVIVLPVAHLYGRILAFCRITIGCLHSDIECHRIIQSVVADLSINMETTGERATE